MEVLRRAGNPFRNYFARNPDDEVCARYHVPELYARERQQLLGVVDLYRYDPTTHTEVVPILGNKGAGKTHLLHSIKHGQETGWQLLVTPGTYQKDTEFLEYLLFQVIDTLLGGGTQHGARPLQFVSDDLTRQPKAVHTFGGWSHDGEYFAFSANREDESRFDVYVRKVGDPDAKRLAKGPGGYYTTLGWSPDDRWLVSVGWDEKLKMWDLATGEVVWTWKRD